MYKKGDIVLLKDNFKYCKNIQGKTRPVLVVSNDVGNHYSNICLVSPLTTKKKKSNQPTHININYNDSVVLTEQIFTVNQSDLIYISKIDKNDMKKVNEALKVSLSLSL